LGIELILFQAFTPPAVVSAAYEGRGVSPTTFKEREEQIRASAMTYLDGLVKAFQEKGLSASSIVKSGSAPDQILEYAEANAIDLIAMSTHGRSGIGRWVLGSVTDKVLHAGDTAVLTVRATKV
jgi:nucleotide-binding universal stress UspA family protein